jgi:hypothetical protein
MEGSGVITVTTFPGVCQPYISERKYFSLNFLHLLILQRNFNGRIYVFSPLVVLNSSNVTTVASNSTKFHLLHEPRYVTTFVGKLT